MEPWINNKSVINQLIKNYYPQSHLSCEDLFNLNVRRNTNKINNHFTFNNEDTINYNINKHHTIVNNSWSENKIIHNINIEDNYQYDTKVNNSWSKNKITNIINNEDTVYF